MANFKKKKKKKKQCKLEFAIFSISENDQNQTLDKHSIIGRGGGQRACLLL